MPLADTVTRREGRELGHENMGVHEGRWQCAEPFAAPGARP